MRTIRVTGKGLIKVHPDMTRITITLEGRSLGVWGNVEAFCGGY